MNILQIGKYYAPVKGGIETHVKNVCEGLAQKGVDVTCIVSSHSRKTIYETRDGVHLIRCGKLLHKAPPVNISLPFILRKRARDADIVHIHMPNPCAEVSVLLAKPKKLIVSYHADIVNKRGAGAYLPVQRRVLRKADRILVSSLEYAQSSPVLRDFLYKCVPVPYSIEASAFENAKKREIEGSPVFLFVGRLVPYKGVEYFIKAMEAVKGTAVIVGQGPLFKRLKRLAKRLKLAERVHFFPEISDEELPSFYHAADVVVLPSISRAEAFGIVQLEAMACGKPVISTKLNTTVDVVNQHLKTGLIVPPKNVHVLAEAMNKLGGNKMLRSKLGQAGKERAKEFTQEAMIAKIFAVYRQVLVPSS